MFEKIKIALVKPPHRLDAFTRVLVKKLQKFKKEAEALDAEWKKLPDKDEANSIWGEIYKGQFSWWPIGYLLSTALKYTISDLKEKAAKWLKARTIQWDDPGYDGETPSHYYWSKQYAEALKGAIENLNGGRSWAAADEYKHFSKALTQLDYEPDAQDSIKFYREDGGDSAKTVKILLGQLRFKELRKELISELETAYARVETLTSLAYKSPSSNPPTTQKVEKLYHASVNAVKLFSSGFSARIPDAGGLGGSKGTGTGREGTSFTYDLYQALAIARGLKEVIEVANGRVKTKDIYEWARSEGLLEKALRQFGYGSSQKTPGTDVKSTFWFYKAYKHVRDFSRAWYDPNFFQVKISDFKGLNARNVGVIVAEINMDHPDVGFMGGREREVRVPSEAIIKLVKLIR